MTKAEKKVYADYMKANASHYTVTQDKWNSDALFLLGGQALLCVITIALCFVQW